MSVRGTARTARSLSVSLPAPALPLPLLCCPSGDQDWFADFPPK